MKKCLVLFSGGLDSRLVIKIMQEQGFEILAVFFKLPFQAGCCNENCSFNFSQMQGVKLQIVDATKGKLLEEYLELVEKFEHGRGSCLNPCIDCRIFILKKAKEIADKENIELIVTGEVLGERPMSQHNKAMKLVEEKSGLSSRILRPLSAKLLPETNAEKNKLVDREKLYAIQGRRRVEQISLAKKFKINFPTPAGGCLLCEKELKNKFQILLKNKLIDDKTLQLFSIGRHFYLENSWVILGRDKSENKFIENLNFGKLVGPFKDKPSARILTNKKSEKIENLVDELTNSYSKNSGQEKRKKFERYKL